MCHWEAGSPRRSPTTEEESWANRQGRWSSSSVPCRSCSARSRWFPPRIRPRTRRTRRSPEISDSNITAKLKLVEKGSTLTVTGTANGMDPMKHYHSLIYDSRVVADAGRTHAFRACCRPSAGSAGFDQMQLGSWQPIGADHAHVDRDPQGPRVREAAATSGRCSIRRHDQTGPAASLAARVRAASGDRPSRLPRRDRPGQTCVSASGRRGRSLPSRLWCPGDAQPRRRTGELRDAAVRDPRADRDDHAEPAGHAEHDRPADARRGRGERRGGGARRRR